MTYVWRKDPAAPRAHIFAHKVDTRAICGCNRTPNAFVETEEPDADVKCRRCLHAMGSRRMRQYRGYSE